MIATALGGALPAAHAALKLADGRRLPLPEVGPRTNQGLADSVRAWLERTAVPAEGSRE